MPQKLSVTTLNAFNDNYIWLIHNNTHAIVVDPGEAAPVLDALSKYKLQLVGILLTHRHEDHIGGVSGILNRYHIPVYGPKNEKEPIKTLTNPVTENDEIIISEMDFSIKVMETPGHTIGHVLYYAQKQGWLFCGDTLFGAGCGRIFEGNAEMMAKAMDRIAALPNNTLIYCGHEYTVSNLKFALAVEPDNEEIKLRLKTSQAKREKGQPTVPFTLAEEKATNPFLRYAMEKIMDKLIKDKLLAQKDPIESFTTIREWKNNF